ncbi:hypothetical protein F2P81_011402 [Scophthalmus maximus]|uniref:Uncharacterized protein n=1 Tax=Scophthalmus maximus TaxID=52904 RepID=A0A6A4SW42_SCOMX|nr:hypothetical protein F2P81_011402 [Scophthalmus maximus]
MENYSCCKAVPERADKKARRAGIAQNNTVKLDDALTRVARRGAVKRSAGASFSDALSRERPEQKFVQDAGAFDHRFLDLIRLLLIPPSKSRLSGCELMDDWSTQFTLWVTRTLYHRRHKSGEGRIRITRREH